MRTCQKRYSLSGAEISIQDQGALEITIKARLETALMRAVKGSDERMKPCCSCLIPGDFGMIQHALFSGADSILLDLEDAVALTEKDAARKMVACYLKDYDFKDLIVTVVG